MKSDEKSSEEVKTDELFAALQNVIEEKHRIELENEAIKADIESLKNQVSEFKVQSTLDFDDVIQESLQLKAKLHQA